MIDYDRIPPKNKNDRHMGLFVSFYVVVNKMTKDYQQKPSFQKGWEFLNGKASVILFDRKLLNSGADLGSNLDTRLRHKGKLKHDAVIDPSISNGIYWFYIDCDNYGEPPENIRKMFELLLVKCSTVYTQYGFKPIDGSYVFSLSEDIVINITVKDGVIYLYGVKYELPDFLKQYIQPVLSTLGAIPAFWFIKEGEEQFLESIRTEQHPPKVTLEEFIKENTLSKLSDSDVLQLGEIPD